MSSRVLVIATLTFISFNLLGEIIHSQYVEKERTGNIDWIAEVIWVEVP